MFTSFDEDKFWQAIEEKDYLCLKVNTISTILNDPTFERGETDQILKILDEKVPEIFEEEIKLSYEERLERKEWDKRYFTKLTYWFQENFAKSRIAYITEVGKVVHEDTAREYAKSMAIKNSAQSKPMTKEEPILPPRTKSTKVPEKKRENFPMAGVLMAAGVLVVVLGLLILYLME